MHNHESADSSAIDDAADRFEGAWRAGQEPLIEDYLSGAPTEVQARLFEELLKVERELRRRHGAAPGPEIYRRRFPGLLDVIDRVFATPAEAPATEFYAYAAEVRTLTEASTLPQGDGADSHTESVPNDPRYRVLHHHADGGIGRVSVALDLELRRKVALKELKERFADDPQARQRFLVEVELTGRLEHPGIVPVYSLGRDGRGRPFYAMRFIEGDDLERAIKSFHAADSDPARAPGERALALRRLLRRFIDVCNVVDYAHSRGVLHRDLKPSNVLLGPYGETLVVDWGMAKRVDEPPAADEDRGRAFLHDEQESYAATQQGFILGTIPYMSPEQAEGKPLQKTSDVYSLGATLYHLVTGRPPIEKAETFEMLCRARECDFPAPRQVNPTVPPALEAICLKAMSNSPDSRYPTPRALADEIEHWLADEPVSAWDEPWRVRARRWVGRHRTPVAAAAAALAVTVIATGHLFYDYHLRKAERRAHANGLLVALRAAEVGEVPRIASQLRPDRSLVLTKLQALAGPGRPELESARRNAALALLPDDPAQATFLLDRLLRDEVNPREIMVIRQALLDNGLASKLAGGLWARLDQRSESSPPNLGAAGALALFAPRERRWSALSSPIAQELATKGPLAIDDWRAVFQPIERHLAGPLRALLSDDTRPKERLLALSLLLNFAVQPANSRRDLDLALLIPDASPEEFVTIRRALEVPAHAVEVLSAKLDGPAPRNDNAARRRGRIAAALIVLGSPDRAWPLLRRGPDDDPGVRTELIHNLTAYGVDPGAVAARLAVERDVSAQRALVIALGEFPPPSVRAEVRRPVVKRLSELYCRYGDPGTHSAIDWLFRTRWGLDKELDAVNAESNARTIQPGRNWFVNSEGVAMAIVNVAKPIEFQMGSPDDEEGRDTDERSHLARLDRSFAIATREVTAAQFERFRASGAPVADAAALPRPPRPDAPAAGVDWFAAAAYCNWLSRRDNLEPYYRLTGTGLSVPDQDGLGYRLPSEREWEFACRAGSSAPRPEGAAEGLLAKYAWFLANADRTAHPVGQLKPNDLGLFDMLGNVFEWTEDRYARDSVATVPALSPQGAKPEASGKEVEVVLRGGSFNSPATMLRSAYRERSSPSDPLETYGFRYVRTLRAGGANAVPTP
jgi:formylglycine-generating enzyme required for sulfatase activity